MPFVNEVETQFQQAQFGIEADATSPYAGAGTGAVATVRLGSVNITPGPKRQSKTFTARGHLLPTVHRIGRKHTDMTFEGEATYEELSYFIKDIVSDAQINPVTANQVYTVEAGGLKIPGSIVTGWTLRGNRDEVTLEGTMTGQNHSVAAATAGLTAPAQVPVDSTGVAISVGGTALAKWFEWSVSVEGLWSGVAFGGQTTYSNIRQGAIDGKFMVRAAGNSATLARLDVGSTLAVTVTCTTGAKVFTLAFDARVDEPEAFSDEDGVYAMGLNYTIMNKATKAITVTNV